jgi:hypothetical protein
MTAGATFSTLFLYPAPVCGENFRIFKYNFIIFEILAKSTKQAKKV